MKAANPVTNHQSRERRRQLMHDAKLADEADTEDGTLEWLEAIQSWGDDD